MARKRRPEKAQKGKDGKRARHFHRGRAQGIRNDKVLREVLEPAYAAAEADRLEVEERSAEHRREMKDYAQMWEQLERVSPFAPSPFPAVLG